MNNDKFIAAKIAVAEALEKAGMTLEDFEDELTTKKAGDFMDHIYDAGKGILTGGGRLAGGLLEHSPGAIASAAMLGGAAVGGLSYASNNMLKGDDAALNDRKAQIERYKHLTGRIQQDYHLQ